VRDRRSCKLVQEYEVVIPDERLTIADFKQEGLPAVAAINRELRNFQPKAGFPWHLSLMFQCEDLVGRRMPSKGEQKILDDCGDMLDRAFKRESLEKQNSLFLARITWNATRELIHRVFEPKPINDYLTKIIEDYSSPREFDYRIDDDLEWKLADWHLNLAIT